MPFPSNSKLNPRLSAQPLHRDHPFGRIVFVLCVHCQQSVILDRFVRGEPYPKLAPHRKVTCPYCGHAAIYRKPDFGVITPPAEEND